VQELASLWPIILVYTKLQSGSAAFQLTNVVESFNIVRINIGARARVLNEGEYSEPTRTSGQTDVAWGTPSGTVQAMTLMRLLQRH